MFNPVLFSQGVTLQDSLVLAFARVNCPTRFSTNLTQCHCYRAGCIGIAHEFSLHWSLCMPQEDYIIHTDWTQVVDLRLTGVL